MIVINTQILENYGSHSDSGKFSEDNHYWKFKGGNTYIVDDLDRESDAVAFVMAGFSENSISWKEYPTKIDTWKGWLDSIEGDAEMEKFYKSTAFYVSPKTGTKLIKYSEWEDMMDAENEMANNQYEESVSYSELEDMYGN